VTTASAADVPAVQAAIGQLLPAATVTSASSLAGQVTGSLASTASLAGVIITAAALALAGSLIAGSFGCWRITRLRPAAALTRVA
jgi:mannitol-specific phosphotransferase system IIBC component